jgi:SHS2 domain-containing protein
MLPPGEIEVLDHVADKAIVACADSPSDLFATAAWGMFSLMARMEAVPCEERRDVTVEAESLEDLLVAWLRELQYLSEVEQLVFSGFEIAELAEPRAPGAPWRLRAAAWGAPSQQIEHLGAWVKAVTYHNLLVERRADGAYCAQVTFDV